MVLFSHLLPVFGTVASTGTFLYIKGKKVLYLHMSPMVIHDLHF